MQSLSDPGQSALEPQAAVRRGNGDAVFAWTRSDGANFRVQARARSAAGALSAVAGRLQRGAARGHPQVAVDADGDAVFTWRRSDGANFLVEARTRSAGGTLRPFTTLSDPGQSAFEPQVAVDDDGDAAVTWRRSDGANTRIQASAGPQRRTPPGCVPARQPFISPPWVPERLTARRRDPVVSARQLLRYEAEPSAFEAQKTAVDDSRLCRKRG